MSAFEKPVLVLVPGAWNSPYHYSQVIALLGAKGYEVVADRLPTCGSKKPELESVFADVEAVRKCLVPLINSGREVIMLMHSYGGCPGSAAVVGLGKEDMIQQGKKGGVIGLIFICAFIAAEGDSMLAKLPGQKLSPWHGLLDDGQVGVKTPKEIFYHDVLAPHDQLAIDMLKPQAYNYVATTIPSQAWQLPFYNGRRAFLKCTEDKAIPLFVQDAMLQQSGVEWFVSELITSHSPHLSRPQGFVDFVVQEAEKFALKT